MKTMTTSSSGLKYTAILLPVLILTVLTGCTIRGGSDKTGPLTLTVDNKDPLEHTDEQIVITRSRLEKLEKQWEQGLVPLVVSEGDTIPTQTDDLDDDGRWDELALVLDISGKSKKELLLYPVEAADLPSFPRRAHAFLGKSPEQNGIYVPVKDEILPVSHLPQAKPPLYQMEGPVWENDQIAFRLYFDSRNGKDIFGKKVSDIVMDSIGLPGDNYHKPAPWGMDVLKAGSSLGAGAIAFLTEDKEGEKQLYRLGPQVEEMKYRIIADGPVRAIIRISYTNVRAGAVTFNVEDEITIWAGSPGYASKVTISGSDAPIQLVTGIVNLHTAGPPITIREDDYAVLATHDRQSENNDYLGMAVLASSENVLRFDEVPREGADITSTYTMVLDIASGEPVGYEFLAAWEGRDKAYADSAQFMSGIASYARQQHNPVNIVVQ